ncbi:MAG: hypothetical protein PHF35_04780 [Candidatus Moranbacteria bacterium]|nr:hypothetical protein [Candidatus Moranbacteria bacterium]
MTKEIVFENLKDFHEAARAAGVGYWLFEGLLLGIYRDGGPVYGDEDDTDVAIEPLSEEKRLKLLKELEKRGLWPCIIDGKKRDKILVKGKLEAIQVERGGNRIDICVLRMNEHAAYVAGGNYYLVFPKHHFEGRETINWNNFQFDTVKDVEGFLQYKYRNWQRPVYRGQGYCYEDTALNRAYVENWDFKSLPQ